jgi:hypothetical protein
VLLWLRCPVQVVVRCLVAVLLGGGDQVSAVPVARAQSWSLGHIDSSICLIRNAGDGELSEAWLSLGMSNGRGGGIQRGR